ncbi:hypothetical protein T190115A13A_150031 [Tenacibaculum sp. 190524A02b]|uniref:Transposase n=1 Tax=Tenacibaculum vairaonense TaxID=3137860 RepID=A0ABP1F4L3_9FLAO
MLALKFGGIATKENVNIRSISKKLFCRGFSKKILNDTFFIT